ncbi:MAG: convertase [Flavobacterium sp.]|nr:convertase [Flavobacterium sp.]|tara:strand:+ start:7908 stop:11153 length:3246 start_codon:yes stop_codon:yes gene_type:complete
MIRKLFLTICLMAILPAVAQQNLWERASDKDVSGLQKLERASVPKHFSIYHLNLNNLKQLLQQAPLRGGGGISQLVLPFPDADGVIKQYRIYEAPVMDTALSAKYPGLKSYVGQGVEEAAATIRFSVTPFGLHNMALATGGTTYTDPYTTDLQYYIVYKREGLSTSRSFHCGVTDTAESNTKSAFTPLSTQSTDGVLRTYRLAMACTIEYAAFHINAAGLTDAPLEEQKAAVLAAMNITVTRVNSVYERDLSITLELIPNNDELIFIESDEFNNENEGFVLLDQSQEVIDEVIGFDNYDIGHTVSTGGGGVAQLFSPCSGSKARGITGLPSPVGDPFDIDYVAHEMGHQFGGNHSFNNSCSGNRSNENAYEPGSGTTIMAYAGICPPNVQSNSDAHFHANSIAEMSAFISTGGNCAESVVTGNVPPVVDAGPDYTIPRGTAFILSGNATDANNDAMTYNWEQMDNEISEQPPVPESDEGPNFRSLPSKEVPQRYMPDIEEVLNNNLTPTWEVIANVEREYNFAFTVRDNNVLGGQVVTDFMKVNVSGSAGPFAVTSPNNNVSWLAGSNHSVTWNVAGTTANGVNTPYVDIYLSTDGGFTYPVILASKVPNDGTEIVTIPNSTGTDNRIMVKGHENIFYDLGNSNFTIVAPEQTMAITVEGQQNITSCVGTQTSFTFVYNAYAGFAGTTTFSATGNPEGSTVTFNPATATADGTLVTMTITAPESASPGLYTLNVLATSGSVIKAANVYLDLLDTNFGTITLTAPANGDNAVFNQVAFNWTAAANATGYEIEVAGDEAFEDIVATATIQETNYEALLEEANIYYWRVRPLNEGCAGSYGEANMFITGITECNEYTSADVPVVIPDENAGDVSSVLALTADGSVQKVSVTLDITHTWVTDLTAVLVSPQGTTVQLFSDECGDQDNVFATFDDDGNPLNCATNPAISGIIAPDEALSVLNGEPAAGVWTLQVSDSFAADGGAINNWSLTICTVQQAPLANGQKQTTDFVLYPNPNNGNFTIQYIPNGQNDVFVTVYDIRGRQLVNQKYTAQTEEVVSLGNAEAGVYLVTLQDGERSITKKVIVN